MLMLVLILHVGQLGRGGEHRGHSRAGGRERSHDHLGRKRDGAGENKPSLIYNLVRIAPGAPYTARREVISLVSSYCVVAFDQKVTTLHDFVLCWCTSSHDSKQWVNKLRRQTPNSVSV